MGVVVIGVDAHKHSHTLVAVDEVGRRWRATASVDTLIEVARCVAHGLRACSSQFPDREPKGRPTGNCVDNLIAAHGEWLPEYH